MALFYEDYKDQGLMVITLLVETLDGDPPDVDDLNEWADEFDITHPVVSDPYWEVTNTYSDRERPGLPSYTLMAPGMQIITAANEVEEEEILAVLP